MGAHFSASWKEILIFLSSSIATFLLGLKVLLSCLLRLTPLSILSAILLVGDAIRRVKSLASLGTFCPKKCRSAAITFLAYKAGTVRICRCTGKILRHRIIRNFV